MFALKKRDATKPLVPLPAVDDDCTEVAFDLVPGLSLPNVRQCAKFSSLAYTATPTFSDDATDTNVIVRRCSNAVVVAFQGTKHFRQWIQDSKFWKVKDDIFPGVHAGFAQDYRTVSTPLREAVVGSGAPELPIVITGHSKGAAEASLFAYDLACRGYRNRIHSVITFGQPRTGTKAYADKYNRLLADITFRWQDAEDIVTRLPRVGYWHHERCYFINAWDKVIIDPYLRIRVLSDVVGIVKELLHGRVALLDDHFMADYETALTGLKLEDLYYGC